MQHVCVRVEIMDEIKARNLGTKSIYGSVLGTWDRPSFAPRAVPGGIRLEEGAALPVPEGRVKDTNE